MKWMKVKIQKRVLCLSIGMMVGLVLPAKAAESRRYQPIKKTVQKDSTKLPKEIDREQIEQSVRTILSSWNTPALRQYLSKKFYDKQRLLDSISKNVPRDAHLRLLALRDLRVLDQKKEKAGKTFLLSATVKTSLEYEDSQLGFQKLEGENEIILKVTIEEEK